MRETNLKRQANVNIPTKHGVFQMMAYATSEDELMPHMVLINPQTDFSTTVNVRVHSECMTGDVFGSYRCECGEQLDYSLRYVDQNGGLVIYLRQEGRGIGIINKLHAYVKQDEGYDTAEANKILGFGYDDRTYEDAIAILDDLEVESINLITNNPDKIEALESCTIHIENRIPIKIAERAENADYIKTKREFFGHNI